MGFTSQDSKIRHIPYLTNLMGVTGMKFLQSNYKKCLEKEAGILMAQRRK